MVESSEWQCVESEKWVAVDEDALVDGSGKRRDRGYRREEMLLDMVVSRVDRGDRIDGCTSGEMLMMNADDAGDAEALKWNAVSASKFDGNRPNYLAPAAG